MATYKITITMPQATVQGLQNSVYSLYAFKGVSAPSTKGGVPLVWFSSTTFSQTTVVSWEEQYDGYTSQSAIIPQGTITAGASYPMDLGTILNITDSAGDGNVVSGGTINALSLNNTTTSPFPSAGISQLNATTNQTSPLCAFPLSGGNLSVFAPIEIVVLGFATHSVDTGTVIMQSFTPAAQFNLTVENELAVAYGINTGWASTDPNITLLPSGTDLVPVLLRASASLSKRLVASYAQAPQKAETARVNGAVELRNGGHSLHGVLARA